MLANAAKETVQYIKQNIIRYHISCDYSECSSYLFSAEEKQNKILDEILESNIKVGIETVQAYKIPFSLDLRKRLK